MEQQRILMEEFYDLTTDPAEIWNVIGHHPRALKELGHSLQMHMQRIHLDWKKLEGFQEVKIDDEVVARLRGLGYLD